MILEILNSDCPDFSKIDILFPEILELKGIDDTYPAKHKDNYLHTIDVVKNTYKATTNINIRLASILHDIGKASSKKYIPSIGWSFHNHEQIGYEMLSDIFKRFDISKLNIPLIENIVLNHGFPKEFGKKSEIVVSDSALRRFDKSIIDLEALILFCQCDLTTTNLEKLKRQRDFYTKVYDKILEIRQLDEESKWRCVITGNDIMEYHKVSGKMVGQIKKILETAIHDNLVPNTYDEAYEYMKNIKI